MRRLSLLPLVLLANVAFPQPTSDEISSLTRVVVLAGQFPTGEQPGALLNSLDIVKTPGATADINRALQSLPGIQLPDEGNALFVRGGDSFETITLVNGLRYPASTRLSAPAGNFAGTLSPFEARRIYFASGGFGARFGNALSGVVDLETLGAPPISSLSLGGRLGGLSFGGNVALGEHAGIGLVATRTNTAPIFALNGSSRHYPEAPNGHDFAANAAWEYRPGGELRLFGVEQLQHLALDINLPAQRGVFRHRSLNRLTTLSWKDQFGAWTPQLSVGEGSLERVESVNSGDVGTKTEHRQFAGRVSFDASERVQLSVGAEGAREHTTLTKSISPSGTSSGSNLSATIDPTRLGFFLETDAVLAPHVRAVAGLRTDYSTLTHRETYDPRLSLAWEPRKAVTLSLAGGIYHQIPETYNFFSPTGRVVLSPMRVTQFIASLQLGKGTRLARIEMYAKDYSELVSLNRSYLPIAHGTGRAEGCDVFLKHPLPFAASARLTYSYVDSQRTDPESGRLAPAAFDVHHTATLIVERSFHGWIVSAAARYASGRPLTPITGGRPDASGGFTPVYGAPFSERLPSLLRFDLSASRYYRLNAHTSLVLYASLNNALNRRNTYTYEYTPDFSQRQRTPSLFNRSLYFGFSLQFN